MLGYESSWKEIEQAKPEGAVIGIGATEQHGPHLPLCMDNLSGQYLARGIAEELDWFLLPFIPIGASREHLEFPGTVTLTSETMCKIFEDVVNSIRHYGISKLVIVSGHGGNWFLKMMTRELNFKYDDMTILLVNTDRWFYPVLTELTDDQTLHHAGEHETAIVQYLRPDLVKDPLPDDINPDYGFDLLDLVPSRTLVPEGHWGYPSKATPEKGKIFLEKALKVAIDYIRSRLKYLEEFSE